MVILLAKLEEKRKEDEAKDKKIQEEYEKAAASGAPLESLRAILRKKKPLHQMQIQDWAIDIGQRFGVNVVNFENPSWADGMAFAALIANFRPDLIDITKLNSSDGVQNIRTAFKAAEVAGCHLVIDPEDVPFADDKSIATQIFSFYRFLWDYPPVKNPPKVKGGAPAGASRALSSF